MKKMFSTGTLVKVVDFIDPNLLGKTGIVMGVSSMFDDCDYYFVRLHEKYYGSFIINFSEGCLERNDDSIVIAEKSNNE